MNNTIPIALLKSFVMFGELDDRALESIVQISETELFPANSIIVKQGEHGEKIYFVLEGSAEAYIINKEGNEVIVGIIEKGNFFGELALLIDGIRNCFVKAKTDCTLLSLTKNKFQMLVEKYHSINNALLIMLSQRLGSTLHLMSEKKQNILVVMLISDQAMSRVNHFETYFKEISPNPVMIIDKEMTKDEITKLSNQHENKFILYKSNKPPEEYLLKIAKHIINFNHNESNQFVLNNGVSTWKIEHTARKITNKTIGIALCSGGAPGAAHFGVLKVLHEANIPLDYIVGTSVGAVAGGTYAFGYPMEKVVSQLHDIFNQSAWISLISLIRHLSLNFSGILKNSFYKKILYSFFGDSLIEDAKLPFAAIASDLYTGNTIIIKSGKVIDAVIASNAAPVIFEPVRSRTGLLVDGVATSPLPIQELIDSGIDIKIAVPIPQLDLAGCIKQNPKLLSVFLRTRSMMAEQITQSTTALANVIIRPQVNGIGMDDWKKLNIIIEAGETAAKIALKRIQYLFHARS